MRPQFIPLVLAAGLGGCAGGSSDAGGTNSLTTSATTATTTTNLTTSTTSTTSTVEAGYNRIVIAGNRVTLSGAIGEEVSDPTWTQLEGTAVTMGATDELVTTFTAPTVAASEVLVFELSASDGNDQFADLVYVEVHVPDGSSDPTAVADFSDRDDWQCTEDPAHQPGVNFEEVGGYLSIDGNGIPAHATGTFPNDGNPNTIGVVYENRYVTLEPEHSGIATQMGEFGVTLDAIKLERDTAESYNNAGEWRYEAITAGLEAGASSGVAFTWLGTDCNNAHVQPTGAYHYHGLPEGLIDRLGEADGEVETMILGGYAADGFPFYLRYGHEDPQDAASPLIVLQGSWELRSGTRPSGPGGSYDGTFREDWEYQAGTGDLDECNGRFGVTPEYPDGIYHYVLTDDYPYIPRCVFGTPDASFRRGRP